MCSPKRSVNYYHFLESTLATCILRPLKSLWLGNSTFKSFKNLRIRAVIIKVGKDMWRERFITLLITMAKYSEYKCPSVGKWMIHKYTINGIATEKRLIGL